MVLVHVGSDEHSWNSGASAASFSNVFLPS